MYPDEFLPRGRISTTPDEFQPSCILSCKQPTAVYEANYPLRVYTNRPAPDLCSVEQGKKDKETKGIKRLNPATPKLSRLSLPLSHQKALSRPSSRRLYEPPPSPLCVLRCFRLPIPPSLALTHNHAHLLVYELECSAFLYTFQLLPYLSPLCLPFLVPTYCSAFSVPHSCFFLRTTISTSHNMHLSSTISFWAQSPSAITCAQKLLNPTHTHTHTHSHVPHPATWHLDLVGAPINTHTHTHTYTHTQSWPLFCGASPVQADAHLGHQFPA